MMLQYRELKKRYPDYLLLFRLGDFYELFFEDAHEGASLLQITLTSRQKGEGAIPMAGIPHHAADGYIARLIRAGRKVAVCEQMEAPSKGKKLVRREVVRVITPGTLTDTQYLDGAANNFLLALHRSGTGAGGALGAALVDVSTGEFWIGEASGEGGGLLEAALLRQPAESLLAREAEPALATRLAALGLPVTSGEPSWFSLRSARERLAAHFRVSSLDSLGIGDMSAGIQAAGAALAYLQETQGDSLGHLTRLQRLAPGDALMLDPTAVATLELFERAHDRSARGSLCGIGRGPWPGPWEHGCSGSGFFVRCSISTPSRDVRTRWPLSWPSPPGAPPRGRSFAESATSSASRAAPPSGSPMPAI